MGDRSTDQDPEDGGGQPDAEHRRDRSQPQQRPALSLQGIQLVVRTMVDAPLHQTARLFPHVINKLADAWHRRETFDAVIDELLFTDRPDRQGFPPRVLRELTDLRCLHERKISRAALADAGDGDPAVIDAASLRRRLMYIPPAGRRTDGD